MSHTIQCTALLAAMIGTLAGPALAQDPLKVLFVGNSYTFGRLDPVLT